MASRQSACRSAAKNPAVAVATHRSNGGRVGCRARVSRTAVLGVDGVVSRSCSRCKTRPSHNTTHGSHQCHSLQRAVVCHREQHSIGMAMESTNERLHTHARAQCMVATHRRQLTQGRIYPLSPSCESAPAGQPGTQGLTLHRPRRPASWSTRSLRRSRRRTTNSAEARRPERCTRHATVQWTEASVRVPAQASRRLSRRPDVAAVPFGKFAARPRQG